MPASKPRVAKKFLVFTSKLLGTALLWIGTAILTKLKLAPHATNWQTTLQQMPLWALVVLIVLVPIGWLLVEFMARCFIEVRARLLERTAPRFAQWLMELPGAGHAVLGRWWDACLARLGCWRFDGLYQERITQECQQLHSQTGLLNATAGYALEQTYIELNMASNQYTEIDPRLLASSIRGRESIYGFLRAQQAGTALAVLGRPGGGKTTLLRHLALVYAQNKQGQRRLRRRMPILIELRRVTDLFPDNAGSNWKSPTLIHVVQHYWKRSAMGDLVAKAPRDWLKRHLASGRVLVMVDGLDEVPHRLDPADPNLVTPRQRVSQWVETEMQREGQRDCLFLITSRPGGFAEAPLKHRVSVVEVQPLTLKQSEEFIKAFQFGCQRKEHPTAKTAKLEFEAARATEKFREELRNKPHLSDLMVNPLLLHMVCLVHYLRGRLPADQSDLYKETCDVLLNRDLRAPGIQERLRPEDKLAALRPLADYFMRSESSEAKTTDKLLPMIQPVFATVNFPANDFFEYIAKDSGLLQEVEKGRWDFAHKTFYEYLAAEHWEKRPPTTNELVGWVEQDWWRFALLFYSAKSEDSPVISAALASRALKAWSLAFACLSAGHRINANERAKATSLLHKALSNPNDEDSFNPAAQAILDLRMRQTVSASFEGKCLRRDSFVCQAEYQLFLHSFAKNERWRFLPPHWKSDRFYGEPTEPIVGVTFDQATEFASWARNSGEHAWQLPTFPIEGVDLPDGCWVVDNLAKAYTGRAQIMDKTGLIKNDIARWAKANSLSAMPDQPWEQLLEMILRIHIGAASLLRLFGLLLSPIGRNNKYFANLIGVETFYGLNVAVSMARLDTRHPRNRLKFYEYDYWTSALGRAFYSKISAALSDSLRLDLTTYHGSYSESSLRQAIFNSKSDLDDACGCRLISRALAAYAGYHNLENALAHDSTDTGHIERLIKELDYDGPRLIGDFKDNRLRLLVSALKVVVTQSNPISHRHAWLCYGLCLAELCLPHLSGDERSIIQLLYFPLKLLEARAEGRLQPWEKILMVR